MSVPPDPNTSHRNTHCLQLAGMTFHGDTDGLRRVNRLLDQAARELYNRRPARFPSGTNRARLLITQRLKEAFVSAINEGQVERWLAEQEWPEAPAKRIRPVVDNPELPCVVQPKGGGTVDIRFGALSPSLAAQTGLPAEAVDHLQKDADAVTRLAVRGYLGETARHQIRKRIVRAVATVIANESAPAEGNQG